MKIGDSKSFEKIPVIYGIQNTITLKWYIGSCMDFKARFERHRYYLRHNQHHSMKLQNSYNKHGEDAFEVYILHNLAENEDRFVLEENYIKQYDSVQNGYNMTERCVYKDGFKLSDEAMANFLLYLKSMQKAVIAIDRITGEVDRVFDSVTEAASYYKTNSSNVSHVCKGKLNYIKNHVFVYSKDFDETKDYRVEHHCKGKPKSAVQKEKMSHNKKCSPVNKLNTNHNIVESYYSIQDAAKKNNIGEATLRYRMKHQILCDGYLYIRI